MNHDISTEVDWSKLQSSTYSNGPGNIPRLPERVVDTLIESAGVSRCAPGRGITVIDQTANVERLVHDACEELLARLPSPDQSAPLLYKQEKFTCRAADLADVAKVGDGTVYVAKGPKPFGDWVEFSIATASIGGSAKEQHETTSLPQHLREFVQAVATNYTAIDRETDGSYCMGCGRQHEFVSVDEGFRQPHNDGCIVLRAQALVASADGEPAAGSDNNAAAAHHQERGA